MLNALRPRLARIPMGFRLALINVTVFVALLVSSVAAWIQLDNESTAAAEVYRLGYMLQLHLDNDMLHDGIKGNLYGTLLFLRTDPARARERLTIMQRDVAEFRANLGELSGLRANPAIDQAVSDTRHAAEIYLSIGEHANELAFSDYDTAYGRLGEFHDAFEALRNHMEALTALLDGGVAVAKQEAARRARDAKYLIVATALALWISTTLLVMLISASIRRALAQVVVVARRIAAGDFEDRIDVLARDVVGDLGATINLMGDNLRRMIDQMRADSKRDAFGKELVEALEMADSEHEAHAVVARAMETVSESHAMELLLSDSSRAHLERAAEHPLEGSPGCTVESPFSCVAVRRGNPVMFPDSESLSACPRLRGRPEGSRSATCVPVSFMGRALGVLHAAGPTDTPLETAQVEKLTTLGIQAGARIGTVRAFQRTQLQASTDALTGLSNRRTVEDELGQMLAEDSDFALVMGDLDRFKMLNDAHGHQAGDKALSLYADVVRQCLRENDLAARWGGEEFVIVLRQSNAEDAALWTERLRDLLEMRVSTASSVRFTSSYGIADTSQSRNLTELMRLADEALYASKENGRNRTTIAGDDAPVNLQRHDTEENASIDNGRLSRAS